MNPLRSLRWSLRPTRTGSRSAVFPAIPVRSLLLLLALAGLLFTPAAAQSITGGANAAGAPVERLVATGRLQGDARAQLTRTDRIVVKFREGTAIRLRQDRLTSLDPQVDLRGLDALLANHPGITVVRHFARSEAALDLDRATGQRHAAVPLPDLNLYYRFLLPASADPVGQANALLHALRSLPIVEVAFAEPIPSPASLQLPTPDFTGYQGYLGPSPSGINAQAVWGYPGGRGATVKIIDIEGAWLWTHEDLKTPFFQGGTQIDDLGWRNHGTAVMGEMVGGNNGFGVTGIASDLQVGGCSIGDMSVAPAIDLASSNLAPGDLFLIELHAAGPNSNGSGQYGYVPMEFWQDNFDAIQLAVANGRICIEAGGNGEQDLDDPVYQGLFNRTLRNSGAIMVGAGTPTGLDAEWFTNYGSRLDLNGWGDSVTSCGYGDLQGGAETQWYTGGFSGTSSASPIVSGSVASLQGMSKAYWGITLNASLAAQILFQSGTPWVGSKRIGNRPNLAAARDLLLQGIGTISGTVTDAISGAPVAGAKVLIVDASAFAQTDENGAYTASVMSGAHTVRVTDFFHQTDEQTVTVPAGGSAPHDVALNPLPTGILAGSVLASDGVALPGARAQIVNVPLGAAWTGPAGDYLISGIPAGLGYQAIFGLVPGHGAASRMFAITAGQNTIVNPILADAQTFESDGGSYTGDTPWQWGTPTPGVGPDGAFSGTHLWGTNLSGNYNDNVTAYLTSPAFNFSGATRLYLSFTQWYETEAGFDGGNVQVRSGSNWITLQPVGGYPLDFLAGLNWGSGYSGSSGGWQPAIFNLTPYISSSVQIRFHFGSDSGVNGVGWYLDDVAFDTGLVPGSVQPAENPPAAALEPSRPNPFRQAAQISLRIPEAGQASLRLFDAQGREVRSLLEGPVTPGSYNLSWDGRDAAGRQVPSGAYFYRLELNGRVLETRRLDRLR